MFWVPTKVCISLRASIGAHNLKESICVIQALLLPMKNKIFKLNTYFNPLNAELNPICHLLALLGDHPILHISRIRVKSFKFC